MAKLKQYLETKTELNIIGFVCNWGAYSGVEMAGANKKEYPASIKLIRVMCLGRLHLGLILKAFELGADGVMIFGCTPEDCHYDSSMEKAKEIFTQARKTLNLLGIDPKRLALVEIPVSGDDRFVKRVSAFVKDISQPTVKLKLRKD